jgi:glycosyltransferase involved in cell wall biosynthesis
VARILLLTPQLPYPAQQGTTLRNFNIIRGLADRHQLALLCYVAKDENSIDDSLQILSHYCQPIITVPVNNRTNIDRLIDIVTNDMPDMSLRLQSDEIDGTITSLLASVEEGGQGPFEIVQIEGIEMANVISTVKRASPDSKIVFDNHNAEYELQRRTFQADLKRIRRWPLAAYSLIQARRLKRYEKWACESADHTVAVSNADKDSMKVLAPNIGVSVIPNSVDISDYGRDEDTAGMEYDLVFIGKMDYRPNVDAVLWFANSIWPEILKHRPQTTWAIVGRNPHSRLEKLRDRKGIKITGKVERVHPYLSGGAICIMPLRFGSGTRLKLIEAMASGKAIVSTTIGAEGFGLEDQQELIIADDAEKFMAEILRLLSDSELRTQLGQRAKAFAKQYDYRRVVPKFDDVYDSLLSKKLAT